MEPAPVPFDRLLAHREWVRRVALALVRDESRAADLEQQVWLAALEHPPREARSLRAWLGTVLRNTASKMRRSEERRGRREEAAPPPSPPASPADLVAEAEAHERVVRAVLALEEPYRTTVLLRFFEDLEPAAVAARLAVPVETVRTRVRRALEQVRARLDGEERGDRRAWCHALLPLARKAARGPAAPVAAGGVAAAVVGGILMGTAAKAAAAVAVVGIAGWLLWSPPRDGDAAPDADQAGAAVASADPATPPAAAPAPAVEAAAFPAPAAAEGAFTALLEVTDTRGRPVAGAEVVLAAPAVGVPGTAAIAGWPFSQFAIDAAPAPLSRAIADGSGRAEVAAPRGGRWRLVVRAAGFALVDRNLWIRAGERQTTRVLLRPATSLVGVIRDARGLPVAGAVVFDRGSRDSPMFVPISSAPTGADGRYRLDGLPRGFHEITVLDPRGILHSVDTVRLPGVERLDLRLGGGVTVKGRVLDDSTGKPVEGAKVVVAVKQSGKSYSGMGTAVTGADGAFVVIDLPPGDAGASITVAREGYKRFPAPMTNARDFEGVLAAGTVWEKEIRIQPGVDAPMFTPEPRPDPNAAPGHVEGRVLDPGGLPAAGVTVTAWTSADPFGIGEERVTDAEGRFRYDKVPAGKGSLYARPGARGVGASEAFTLEPGGAVEGLELKMERGGTIAGVVRRADGAPVAGPLLWQARGGFSGVTKRSIDVMMRDESLAPIRPDGTFRLENMAAGTYFLIGGADGCEPGSPGLFDLADGEDKSGVEIVLDARESLALAGVVVDEEGRPVAEARVSTQSKEERGSGGGVSAVTDAEGRFRVEDLPAVVFVVSVVADGFVRATSETGAGTEDIRFVLERNGFLAGRGVEEGNGAPVGSLPVRATPEPRSDGKPVPRGNWLTTTAPDGSFRLEGIRGGTWTVIAGDDGRRGSTGVIPQSRKGVEPGTEGIEIAVGRGTRIAGRFVDEAGEPYCKALIVQAMRRDEHGSLSGVGGEAKPDAQGAFVLGGLESGAYDLWVRPGANLGDETPPSMLLKGVESTREDLVVRVPRGARLRGRVTGMAGPITKGKGGWISVRGRGENWWPATSLRPEADGTFVSEPLDPDWTYDLMAREFRERMGALEGVRPGTGELVLHLDAGLSIRGRVVDETGAPVGAGVPVTAWAFGTGPDAAGARSETRTTAEGAFTVQGLGSFRFGIAVGGGGSEFLPVSAGSTPETAFEAGASAVVIQARRGRTVRGRLVDARGKAAVGLLVEGLSGSTPKVYTGEDGRFVLTGFAEGPFRLRVGRTILGPFEPTQDEIEVRLP